VVDKSGSTNGQSQKKFENKVCTATSQQKRQPVNIYHEISMLAPFFSIACLQLAFPHVETVKYIQIKVPAFVCNIFVLILLFYLINFNNYTIYPVK